MIDVQRASANVAKGAYKAKHSQRDDNDVYVQQALLQRSFYRRPTVMATLC